MNYFISTFHIYIDGKYDVGRIGSKSESTKLDPNVLERRIIEHYRKDYPLPHTVAQVPIITQELLEQQYNEESTNCIEMD